MGQHVTAVAQHPPHASHKANSFAADFPKYDSRRSDDLHRSVSWYFEQAVLFPWESMQMGGVPDTAQCEVEELDDGSLMQTSGTTPSFLHHHARLWDDLVYASIARSNSAAQISGQIPNLAGRSTFWLLPGGAAGTSPTVSYTHLTLPMKLEV